MRNAVRSPLLAGRSLLGLLLLGGCAEKKPPPTPPVPVTVATAERRTVPFELPATGTVEPLQTVAVQAQVSGILQRVAFREGDEVKQGQVLFELDARPYRAALDQASAMLERDRAQAANAAQEAKRYESLAEKQYVTSQQYEQVRTTAAAAQATLAGSQAAVDQARAQSAVRHHQGTHRRTDRKPPPAGREPGAREHG